MHNWSLLFFGLLAVFQPIASYTDTVVDGRQCCNHRIRDLFRDTRYIYGKRRYTNPLETNREYLNHNRISEDQRRNAPNEFRRTTRDILDRVNHQESRRENRILSRSTESRIPITSRLERERRESLRISSTERVENSRRTKDVRGFQDVSLESRRMFNRDTVQNDEGRESNFLERSTRVSRDDARRIYRNNLKEIDAARRVFLDINLDRRQARLIESERRGYERDSIPRARSSSTSRLESNNVRSDRSTYERIAEESRPSRSLSQSRNVERVRENLRHNKEKRSVERRVDERQDMEARDKRSARMVYRNADISRRNTQTSAMDKSRDLMDQRRHANRDIERSVERVRDYKKAREFRKSPENRDNIQSQTRRETRELRDIEIRDNRENLTRLRETRESRQNIIRSREIRENRQNLVRSRELRNVRARSVPTREFNDNKEKLRDNSRVREIRETRDARDNRLEIRNNLRAREIRQNRDSHAQSLENRYTRDSIIRLARNTMDNRSETRNDLRTREIRDNRERSNDFLQVQEFRERRDTRARSLENRDTRDRIVHVARDARDNRLETRNNLRAREIRNNRERSSDFLQVREIRETRDARARSLENRDTRHNAIQNVRDNRLVTNSMVRDLKISDSRDDFRAREVRESRGIRSRSLENVRGREIRNNREVQQRSRENRDARNNVREIRENNIRAREIMDNHQRIDASRVRDIRATRYVQDQSRDIRNSRDNERTRERRDTQENRALEIENVRDMRLREVRQIREKREVNLRARDLNNNRQNIRNVRKTMTFREREISDTNKRFREIRDSQNNVGSREIMNRQQIRATLMHLIEAKTERLNGRERVVERRSERGLSREVNSERNARINDMSRMESTFRKHDNLIMSPKQISTESVGINWQYLLYTLQAIYLSSLVMQFATEKGYAKNKIGYTKWWSPQSLVKVD